jgi:hypothetical protein
VSFFSPAPWWMIFLVMGSRLPDEQWDEEIFF